MQNFKKFITPTIESIDPFSASRNILTTIIAQKVFRLFDFFGFLSKLSYVFEECVQFLLLR